MRQGALQVDVYSRDDQTKLATGKLLTIDNQIDPTTGTAKLKAVFENPDNRLWPNQFVNVHLLLETRKDAITAPAGAMLRGPKEAFAYVVDADNTVKMRPVQIALTQGSYGGDCLRFASRRQGCDRRPGEAAGGKPRERRKRQRPGENRAEQRQTSDRTT